MQHYVHKNKLHMTYALFQRNFYTEKVIPAILVRTMPEYIAHKLLKQSSKKPLELFPFDNALTLVFLLQFPFPLILACPQSLSLYFQRSSRASRAAASSGSSSYEDREINYKRIPFLPTVLVHQNIP